MAIHIRRREFIPLGGTAATYRRPLTGCKDFGSSGAFIDINQSRRGPLARSYNVQLFRSPKFIDTHV